MYYINQLQSPSRSRCASAYLVRLKFFVDIECNRVEIEIRCRVFGSDYLINFSLYVQLFVQEVENGQQSNDRAEAAGSAAESAEQCVGFFSGTKVVKQNFIYG
ncbi:uncharacterized protein LOC118737595 isoform X1 [Rhagoletis pomonella]|uniref:uncharacterized protein LOC118737595 isoform X1 n=1 Tax=Rhagoletis pomonella TaxID=28610 RepID=UPI001782D50C|nr:uncharacterized protein LOC118737595 isoform X1 [Rhagoletis pomonella]